MKKAQLINAFGLAATITMVSPAAYSYQIDAPPITGTTSLSSPNVVNETPPGVSLYNLASAFGQTFSVGASDNVLQSFSFWVKNNKDADFTGNARIKGYVAEVTDPESGSISFVGTKAIFASAEVKTITWDSYGEVRFDTGGVVLQKNKAYAAFISGIGLGDGVADRFLIARSLGDPVADGKAIGLTAKRSSGPSQIEGPGGALDREWSHGVGGGAYSQANKDLAFRATFTAPVTAPVPEPETWAMMLLGLGVVGYAARRHVAH